MTWFARCSVPPTLRGRPLRTPRRRIRPRLTCQRVVLTSRDRGGGAQLPQQVDLVPVNALRDGAAVRDAEEAGDPAVDPIATRPDLTLGWDERVRVRRLENALNGDSIARLDDRDELHMRIRRSSLNASPKLLHAGISISPAADVRRYFRLGVMLPPHIESSAVRTCRCAARLSRVASRELLVR